MISDEDGISASAFLDLLENDINNTKSAIPIPKDLFTRMDILLAKAKCSCGARDKEKCHKESSSDYGKLCCKPLKSS